MFVRALYIMQLKDMHEGDFVQTICMHNIHTQIIVTKCFLRSFSYKTLIFQRIMQATTQDVKDSGVQRMRGVFSCIYRVKPMQLNICNQRYVYIQILLYENEKSNNIIVMFLFFFFKYRNQNKMLECCENSPCEIQFFDTKFYVCFIGILFMIIIITVLTAHTMNGAPYKI